MTVTRPLLQPRPGVERRTELVKNLRTRTGLLRPMFVVPGFVIYTRAQLAHGFANALAISAFLVLILLNKQQCSTESVLVAAACAVLASMATMLCRLLFK